MSKESGEVFGLQIWGHLRGKESRRGGSFTPVPKLWGGKEEVLEDGWRDRGKFESNWIKSKWDLIHPSQASRQIPTSLMLKGGEWA